MQTFLLYTSFFGFTFLIGLIVAVLLFSTLSFYISGRALGSINYEFKSAIKLLGLFIAIGIGFGILGNIVTSFTSAKIVETLLFGLYFVAMAIAANFTYELGILKSILFLILSAIISGITSFLLITAIDFLKPNPSSHLPTTIQDKIEENERRGEEASDANKNLTLPRLPNSTTQ